MQFPLHYHSREDIRARMLQNAATFWGVRSAAALDPMVRLLIEALSAELYGLANDLRNTEQRLLGKLASLLTPDLLTAPLPAHALMQALPADASETLPAHTHFIYGPRKHAEAASGQDVFFTPAVPSRIYDAQVQYIATGNRLYRCDPKKGKTLQAAAQGFLPRGDVWLGIRAGSGIRGEEKFPLYFSWPHFPFDHTHYQLLSLCGCSVNGQALAVDTGFPHETETFSSARGLLNKTIAFDTMPVIIRDVMEYYRDHFLTVMIDLQEHAQHRYPAAFEGVFPEAGLQALQEPLLWLQLAMPAALQQPLLDNMDVQLNVFPVLNRRLHKIKHRFRGAGSIIPVKPGPGEYFFSVHQLTDSKGRQFHPVSYNDGAAQEEDAYSVRLGGAERFDSRNAREMIDYLFELLRDESAAFSAYGYDFLTDVLRNLRQNMALVEQKAQQSLAGMTESTRYIIVKPQNAVEVMYLDYWTTQSEAAHRLRGGLPLTQFEGSGIRADSIQLLTQPVGGRKAAEQADLLQAYKYALTTRDRIVTEDDIQNFCRHELGQRMAAVKVKRGVTASVHPKEGLKKTTDVFITQAPNHPYTPGEWELAGKQLLHKLQARSGIQANYRVFLD
ncbi:MAG: type VI secretion system baseplate subunit TssF [Chitinophaga sp.]